MSARSFRIRDLYVHIVRPARQKGSVLVKIGEIKLNFSFPDPYIKENEKLEQSTKRLTLTNTIYDKSVITDDVLRIIKKQIIQYFGYWPGGKQRKPPGEETDSSQ
jgi:hypothetical protein